MHDDFAEGVEGHLYTTPVSENFIFNNVKITVRFTGKAAVISPDTDPDSPNVSYMPFSFEDTFSLNAGGEVKNGTAPQFKATGGKIVLIDPFSHFEDELEYEYEIIGISGTITPA